MSYILDALNKSEREQSTRQPPGLGTVHQTARQDANGARPWIIVLVIVGVLNGLLLTWWLSLDEATTATAPPPTSSETPAALVIEANTSTAVTEASESELLVTPADLAREPAREPAAIQPTHIMALPLNIQRQIPDLVFSSHIYASEPSFRLVNINGNTLREGASVANGIRLVEITEEGVVLTYLHYTFEVSVLRDWSFD